MDYHTYNVTVILQMKKGWLVCWLNTPKCCVFMELWKSKLRTIENNNALTFKKSTANSGQNYTAQLTYFDSGSNKYGSGSAPK